MFLLKRVFYIIKIDVSDKEYLDRQAASSQHTVTFSRKNFEFSIRNAILYNSLNNLKTGKSKKSHTKSTSFLTHPWLAKLVKRNMAIIALELQLKWNFCHALSS